MAISDRTTRRRSSCNSCGFAMVYEKSTNDPKSCPECGSKNQNFQTIILNHAPVDKFYSFAVSEGAFIDRFKKAISQESVPGDLFNKASDYSFRRIYIPYLHFRVRLSGLARATIVYTHTEVKPVKKRVFEPEGSHYVTVHEEVVVEDKHPYSENYDVIIESGVCASSLGGVPVFKQSSNLNYHGHLTKIEIDRTDLPLGYFEAPGSGKSETNEYLIEKRFGLDEELHRKLRSDLKFDGEVRNITIASRDCKVESAIKIGYPYYVLNFIYDGAHYSAFVSGIDGGVFNFTLPTNREIHQTRLGANLIAGVLFGTGVIILLLGGLNALVPRIASLSFLGVGTAVFFYLHWGINKVHREKSSRLFKDLDACISSGAIRL